MMAVSAQELGTLMAMPVMELGTLMAMSARELGTLMAMSVRELGTLMVVSAMERPSGGQRLVVGWGASVLDSDGCSGATTSFGWPHCCNVVFEYYFFN